MWTTFWPDLLISCLSVGITLGVAYVTYRLERRRQVIRPLRALIDDIYYRRAFALAYAVEVQMTPAATADFEQLSRSILTVKARAQDAKSVDFAKPVVTRALGHIIAACNIYLEDSATDPHRYVIEAMNARDRIYASIQVIASQYQALEALEPGRGAFDLDFEETTVG